ncbi:unnamed protein product [Bursaphelenchus okinawaensis]|uniref:Uncharacterized protein n=1 Tax=Bursaphelenchus okinawaensis TaxID=465554 RepID=A0A811LRI1_9BILA|nr:unnamed protein product [Bursaphelenchus okinawaensis]CAG9127660.1 unnamed protein product [Bursaphelenchus okinawaensis]
MVFFGRYGRVHIFCEAVELPTSPIFLTVRSSSPASDQKGRPPSPMADYDQPHVGNVSFSGLNEPCSVGSHVEVVINAQGGSAQRSEVSVLSVAPSGKRRECKVTHQANSFTAIFQPDEVGQWQIGIVYAGEHIQGSPFDVQVFDADRVNVYGLDVGLVGQELKFTVDAQQAGEGAVKVSIFKNNKQIPCGVVEEGTRHRYRVHFTPDGPARYEIHITFNGMEIKGSPFILDIADASQVSVHGDFLKTAAVDKMAHFFVNAIGATAKDLNVVITGPSGKQKHAKVAAIENKAFRVEWKPVEVGEHKIDVQLYDQSIYDQHLLCNVGDPELVTVRNIPQYIDLNKIGQDLSFEIDAAAAGSGNLEIIINGGRVTCRVRELATRHFLAEFTPLQPAPHVIEMKFNGEHVRGSPWTLPIRNGQGSVEYSSGSGIRQLRSQHVEDEPYSELVGVGLHRAQVNSVSAFEVNASTGVLKASDVRVRLTDAHGAKLDVRIFEQRNGVRCEYTVKKVGDYLLEIFINNRLIDSGPLTVTGYDLNKIKVQPVKDGAPGEPVQFVGLF